MAQQVNIVLVDDLDGSEATQTIAFGLDGASYEVDLNDTHTEELREALAPYVGVARKVAGRRAAGGPKRTGRSSGGDGGAGAGAGAVREWARANGLQVNERGRISAEVQEAYDAAH